ncbi:hypothetical protein K2W90_04700 [Candidatus Babeliales bacterium]|nr:hypothetical protein [Candidatus Babeliales bacterium]
MFKKILFVSLVLSASSSVHSAATSGAGWIDVKTKAEKRREKQTCRARREAQAEAAEKERRKELQKKKRLKRKSQKKKRRKNHFVKEFDAYFVATEQGEDLEQVDDILDRMCALIKRGVSISTINPATGKTMLRQAIDGSRLCLVEFLLRNGAVAIEEDIVLLRNCVRDDMRRNGAKSAQYSVAFMASACSGVAQDKPDETDMVKRDLEIEAWHQKFLLAGGYNPNFNFGASVSDSD